MLYIYIYIYIYIIFLILYKKYTNMSTRKYELSYSKL